MSGESKIVESEQEHVGFSDVNRELMQISRAIQLNSRELVEKRLHFRTLKAGYENARATVILSQKAQNPNMTQLDLEAMAETETFNIRLDMIAAESVYHAVSNELQALRDRLDALKETSFNLRKEASLQ